VFRLIVLPGQTVRDGGGDFAETRIDMASRSDACPDHLRVATPRGSGRSQALVENLETRLLNGIFGALRDESPDAR
jgi:hypothetical protein